MERKVKMDISALLIVAIVFVSIGVAFVPIGIVSVVAVVKGDSFWYIFALVFGGLGTLFLLLGILMVYKFIDFLI